MAVLFARLEDEIKQVYSALRPVHAFIGEMVSRLEYNVAADLSLGTSGQALWAELAPFRNPERPRSHVWGLKLRTEPAVDQDGDKTWIKNMHACSRMWQMAAPNTEVGWRELTSEADNVFQKLQPQERWYGTEILLCAFGPNAQAVLQEALSVNLHFNSRHWDPDGYYCGPGELGSQA